MGEHCVIGNDRDLVGSDDNQVATGADLTEVEMVQLVDSVLADLRAERPQHLMLEAAGTLSPRQCHTAYAVATEIMRSDGPLEPDERNILTSLAYTFKLEELETDIVHTVMDVLHASLLEAE